jgi:hypothetical protein
MESAERRKKSMKKSQFPIPDGVVEVTDEYQKNLAHYELLHLKPKGTILFAKETREIHFQFFASENKDEGIYARLDEPMSPTVRRILDYIEKYPRTECYINMVLLQFKMIFIADRSSMVHGSAQKTFLFKFPEKFMKTHRRRFIRIPFNDSFPAELKFEDDRGIQFRKLKDLSREGMKVRLEEGDENYFKPGSRLRHSSLKILNRDMPLGLTIVAVYPGAQAGLRIIAISEEDKTWIKGFIRVLMKQILNLPDPPFDDQIEKDPKDET